MSPKTDIDRFLAVPRTCGRVVRSDNEVVDESGVALYHIEPNGVIRQTLASLSPSAVRQQALYDATANDYLRNVEHSHTDEYLAYLQKNLDGIISMRPLGTTLEVCCGAGHGLAYLLSRTNEMIGVDVSIEMLNAAARRLPAGRVILIQGEAEALPIASESIDTVVVLGGIHHVGNQSKFFAEAGRVLKRGGCLIWREPVDDFIVWRRLREIVYRLSPALDSEVERPLRKKTVEKSVVMAGLTLTAWKPVGLFSYGLFMNSDVLKINALFRFVPGIRRIVRMTCALDEKILSIESLSSLGMMAIGVARKAEYP